MSEVIDKVKEKYPDYRGIPDDQLTVKIAEKYPQYLDSDPVFREDYNNAVSAGIAKSQKRADLALRMEQARTEGVGSGLQVKIFGAAEKVAGFVSQMSPLNVLKRTLEVPTQIEQAAGLLPANVPSPTAPAISPETARKVVDYLDPNSYDEPGSMREGVKAFLADTLSGLTSPDQAAAIVAGVKQPELVGRLFQVETAAQVPQAAQNLSDAIESGDKTAIGRASAALATTAAIPAAIEKGLRGAAAPKLTGILPTEEIKTVAPQTAAALEQTGKGPSAIHGKTTEVLQPVQPQPVSGKGEVPTERPSTETGPRGEPAVPKEAQAISDYERYVQVQAEMKRAFRAGDQEALAKAFAENEQIKNRHQGMPPKPPEAPPTVTETTPKAEPVAAPTAANARPAIRLVGGEVVTGEAGQTHPDIIAANGLKAEEIDQRGFVDDQGNFLDREQAAAETGLPTTKEAERLHSTDLPEAQPTPTDIGEGQPQAVTQPAPSEVTAKAPVAAGAEPATAEPSVTTPVTQEPVGMGGATPSEFPGSKDSLQQLTENIREQGQISPKQSFSERLDQALEGIKAKWKDRPKDVGQALEQIRAGSAVLLDKYRNLEPYTDFKRAIREWTGADNKTALQVRQFVKEIKKSVPDKLGQEAITNWIQADGDKVLLRQRADASKGSVKRGYEMALQLTEPEKALAKNIQSYLETRLNEGINTGIIKQGIDNYITQIWKQDNPVTKALRGDFSGALNPNFRFARKRIFDSYFEGEQAGFVPKDKSVGNLIATYDLAFNRALSARALIKQLHEGKAADGQPIVMLSGKSIPVGAKDAPPDAVLIKPKSAPLGAVAADGRPYRTVDHWALRDWKWATKGPDGSPVFLQGDMLVHPDYYQHLKNVLSASKLAQPSGLFHISRAVLRAGALAKQTKLSLSLFHLDQEGLHAMAHRVNPANLEELDMSKPEQKDLVNHGLQIADPRSQELFSEGLTGGGLVGKIPGVGRVQSWFNDFLFRDYIPRLKMTMALDALERNKKAYADDLASGKITEDQIKALTADEANAAFGELNYRALGRNPTLQDFFRIFALAPDFLEARARFVGRAAMPYGAEQRKALVAMGITLYVGGRILNQWLDGDPHYDSPFAVYYKGREYRLRTILGDVQHLATDPRGFWYNRMGPAIRGLTEYLTGRDDRGIKRSSFEQLQDLASWFIPIPAQIRSDQTPTQAALASAGVSSRKFDAQTQIFQLVDKWKQSNPDPAVQEQYEQHRKETLPDSIYRPLRDALYKDDMKKSKQEYDKLLSTHSPKAINKAMQAYKPFTGSWRNEAEFKNSLTPEQQKLYDKARQEKEDLYNKFLQLQ